MIFAVLCCSPFHGCRLQCSQPILDQIQNSLVTLTQKHEKYCSGLKLQKLSFNVFLSTLTPTFCNIFMWVQTMPTLMNHQDLRKQRPPKYSSGSWIVRSSEVLSAQIKPFRHALLKSYFCSCLFHSATWNIHSLLFGWMTCFKTIFIHSKLFFFSDPSLPTSHWFTHWTPSLTNEREK